MSRVPISEWLDSVVAELTDANARLSWDRVQSVRERVRQRWLDEIAIETRAACADKEVA